MYYSKLWGIKSVSVAHEAVQHVSYLVSGVVEVGHCLLATQEDGIEVEGNSSVQLFLKGINIDLFPINHNEGLEVD